MKFNKILPALLVGAGLLTGVAANAQVNDTSAEVEAFLSLGHECKIEGNDVVIDLSGNINGAGTRAEKSQGTFSISSNGATLWAITSTADVGPGPATAGGFEISGAGLDLKSDFSGGDQQNVATATSPANIKVFAFIEDSNVFEADTVYRTRAVLTCIAGDGGGDESGGQNPGNDKPVGNAPFDGEQGEVPSGVTKD